MSMSLSAATPQPQPLPPPLVAAKVAKLAKGLSLPWSPSATELAGVMASLKKPCSHSALASAALIGLEPGQGFLEAPKNVQRAVFQQALSRNTLSGSGGAAAGRLAIGTSRGAGSAESARVLDQLSRIPLPPKSTDGLDLSDACAYLRQVCPRVSARAASQEPAHPPPTHPPTHPPFCWLCACGCVRVCVSLSCVVHVCERRKRWTTDKTRKAQKC